MKVKQTLNEYKILVYWTTYGTACKIQRVSDLLSPTADLFKVKNVRNEWSRKILDELNADTDVA